MNNYVKTFGLCIAFLASNLVGFSQDTEWLRTLRFIPNNDSAEAYSSGLNHNVAVNTYKDDCVMVAYKKKRGNDNKITYRYRMQNMRTGKYIGDHYSDAILQTNTPFVGDGLVVNLGDPSIYTDQGEVWMSFSDLKEKIFWGAMKGHKIFKKTDGKSLKNYWVSRFHKGVAAVGLKVPDKKYGGMNVYLIGTLHKTDKSFVPLSKVINLGVHAEYVYGFTEEGYLVAGKDPSSRKHFDTELKSVGGKIWIKCLDEYEKITSIKKHYTRRIFERFSHKYVSYAYNTYVENEKWVSCSKDGSKKEDKLGVCPNNFVNKDGDYLLDDWFLANNKTSYSRQFLGGKVTISLNGKFVELDDTGKITFTFPDGTLDATSFRDGVAFIETEKGVSLINDKGEIIRPWVADWTLTPDFLYPAQSFHAINESGLTVVGSKSAEKTIIVNTDFKIVVSNKYGVQKYYLYDTKMFYIITTRENSTPAKDYTKTYPPNFVQRGKLKHDEVIISTAFIPREGGFYDKSQTEKWYLHNTGTETVTVKLKFDYSGQNNGYSDNAIIFTEELKPGELTYVDPGPIPGVLTYGQSTHADRGAEVTWWIVE